MPNSAWFEEGLRFECTRCRSCCGGAPGPVRVTETEICRLADALGLEPEGFRAAYTRKLRDGTVSLRERPDYDCIFLTADGCQVYDHRPRQCRTWPFWLHVVRSRERWERAARGCPGMNQGRLHDAAEIRRKASNDGTAGSAIC